MRTIEILHKNRNVRQKQHVPKIQILLCYNIVRNFKTRMWGAHGGGAFSGKDYTKVDRSAAYAARWVAKSIVSAGLAKRILVQLSYAIGIAKPLSLHVDTYGSGVVSGMISLKKWKF